MEGDKIVLDTIKYITLGESLIHSGQDPKTGAWFCKDLPCKTIEDTRICITKLNKIYNDFNKKVKKNEK